LDWFKELVSLVLPFLDRVPLVRGILAFALVFFIPGFAWSLLLFRQLKALERIALSFALSLAVVTLTLVGANLVFGLKIDPYNSVLVIFIVTLVALGARWLIGVARSRTEKASPTKLGLDG
jgi:uncharacterized membrane protein